MRDWSRAEVEATVATYFEMLDCEIRGRDYSKAAQRKSLSRLLDHRSDGAIERKHQNISAILIELGFVYISGYKPLRNYQRLLYEVVADRLTASATLVDTLREQMAAQVSVPAMDDILASLVDPPTTDPHSSTYTSVAIGEGEQPRLGADYLALESANRSLGAAGEEFVVKFEMARLINAGREKLAGRVERVATTRGDGLGYDVLSFDVSGRERFIEVKTTNYGSYTPFFVTRNEVTVSRRLADRFHLYRAFEFRRRPRLFCKAGPIEHSFALEASQFTAVIR